MKQLVKLILISLFFMPFFQGASAQYVADSSLVKKPKGFSVKIDSTLLVNVHFRMQNRFGYLSDNLQAVSPGLFDIRVTRARLFFDGFVGNPKLTYFLQFNFSRMDMDDGASSTVINVLRDAIIWYEPIKGIKLGIGQAKLPGNRQRVISSGNLEFTDRSIASNAYNLDRDAGIFANQKFKILNMVVNLKTALTSGEGRNALYSDKGIATTGRIEILPFGDFTNKNDYSEADLEYEEHPKLAIGAVAHYNDKAIRTLGETGEYIKNPRYLQAYMADVLFKYAGVAISSEYLYRGANTIGTAANGGYVMAGQALNTQLSYCFENNTCVAVRYAYNKPNEELYRYVFNQKQYGICFTKFIVGHAIKLQAEIQFREESKIIPPGKFVAPYYRQYMAGFLQLEMGI